MIIIAREERAGPIRARDAAPRSASSPCGMLAPAPAEADSLWGIYVYMYMYIYKYIWREREI